jgi:hypothetical protein
VTFNLLQRGCEVKFWERFTNCFFNCCRRVSTKSALSNKIQDSPRQGSLFSSNYWNKGIAVISPRRNDTFIAFVRKDFPKEAATTTITLFSGAIVGKRVRGISDDFKFISKSFSVPEAIGLELRVLQFGFKVT